MKVPFYIIYSFFTNGSAPQSFIGAGWIVALLRNAPKSVKRKLALQVLGLSPHYFLEYFDPNYAKMSHGVFLEAEFERNVKGREKIYREILAPFLKTEDKVLDYGCGPGFLARAVAPHVKQVDALDISRGVLECAKILNGAPNINYLCALNDEKKQVSEVDVIYSFAVIQHVTDTVFKDILEFCFQKLKPGGKIVLQVQLPEENWRTEEEWKQDATVVGKIKYAQGLHCFARTADEIEKMVAAANFKNIEFKNVSEMVSEDFDDICRTQLLLASKN